GEARFRPTRVPMMAIADEQRIVVAGLASRQAETPDAIGQTLGGDYFGVEGDQRPETEMVTIVRHVFRHMAVVRIVGQVRIAHRDREVVELETLLRGIDMKGTIGG